MNRLMVKFLIVVVAILLVGVVSLYKQKSNVEDQADDVGLISYYLLTDAQDPNAETFEGCDAEYLAKTTGSMQGDLADALNEMFSIKDGFKSALSNSNIQAVVSNSTINLLGDLISAGTCDDPRIKAQIIKTVELYMPTNSYTILLNNSEDEWRCWNDQSGLCE